MVYFSIVGYEFYVYFYVWMAGVVEEYGVEWLEVGCGGVYGDECVYGKWVVFEVCLGGFVEGGVVEDVDDGG